MGEPSRQSLAVAGNLRRLAGLQAEQSHYAVAVALYEAALQWARKAAPAPERVALVEQITRERSVARQHAAAEQAAVMTAV